MVSPARPGPGDDLFVPSDGRPARPSPPGTWPPRAAPYIALRYRRHRLFPACGFAVLTRSLTELRLSPERNVMAALLVPYTQNFIRGEWRAPRAGPHRADVNPPPRPPPP